MNNKLLIAVFAAALLLGGGYVISTQLLDDDDTATSEATEAADATAVQNTPEVAATKEVTPDISATEEITPDVSVTEEVTPDVTITEEVTPDVSEPGNGVSSIPGQYTIAVSYALEDNLPENTPDPPDGFRWIVVVATLGNQTGDTVPVDQDSLALLDRDNHRYSSELPDDNTQPPLVGAALAPGESLLGLVRFAIPEGATADRLEWCPGGNCDQPLHAIIP
ncbi:MAG: hypothetical protein JW966_10740 [Anaerolineae bacterium]|nr:hypothetical protein [Anaerolineae bacterium]